MIKDGELILIWAGGDMDHHGPGTPYRACKDFSMEVVLSEFHQAVDTSGSPISQYVQFENWLVVKGLARPLPCREVYLGSYGRWYLSVGELTP